MYINFNIIHNINGDRMENFELIKHIHEDAAMGEYATKRLLDELKSKDNKIKSILEDIYKEYLQYKEKSEKLLDKKDIEYKRIDLMAKMGTYFGIKKEIIDDNSDSSIASMMIQGLSMGSIEISKKLKAYEECTDKKYLKLVKEFIEFQEEYIEKMKSYL